MIEEETKYLTVMNPSAPRFKGLPKVQQEGTPPRPLVDFPSALNLSRLTQRHFYSIFLIRVVSEVLPHYLVICLFSIHEFTKVYLIKMLCNQPSLE